ncbi:hypothetical protein NBRC111894_311 [Sporolactobacillus inulinus]|uniref:Uncharacterized protein n=1 Tax=Sporolactobacillus inulinus TaxID=2078 RepID=A0A4Y1Z6S5_9BACL|nr:hypothetical protein NBRC111894_311 [Sporolactobacillus inulinus]
MRPRQASNRSGNSALIRHESITYGRNFPKGTFLKELS